MKTCDERKEILVLLQFYWKKTWKYVRWRFILKARKTLVQS